MGKVDVPIIGEKQAASLGRVVISMLAIGISAGLTLIAAAKKIGDIIAEEKVKYSEDIPLAMVCDDSAMTQR